LDLGGGSVVAADQTENRLGKLDLAQMLLRNRGARQAAQVCRYAERWLDADKMMIGYGPSHS
jgi:hypothetical protein